MLGSEMYSIHNLCPFSKFFKYRHLSISKYELVLLPSQNTERPVFINRNQFSNGVETAGKEVCVSAYFISSHFQRSFRDFYNYCYWELWAVTKISMRFQNDLSFEEEMQIMKYSGSIFPCQPSERVIIRAGFTL